MSNQNIIRPPKRLAGDTEAVIRHIYDQINILSNATNRASTGEARDRTGGKSGDIQLVHDKASGQYGIEGRFEEGWMRFGLGEGMLVQSNQRGPFIPPSQNDPTNITKTIQDMFPAITKLRLDVNPGAITSLPIVAIGTDNILKDGDIITVVSSNGYVGTFVVAANVLAAATTITVESAITGKKLIAGSSVYLTQKSLGTWISELENSITIGAGINDFDIITRVNGAINATVTNVPIDPPLPIDIKGFWKLLATDLDTGEVYTLTVFGDQDAGATSINIGSQALTLADNSPIRLDQLSLLSYITLAAGEASIEAQAMQGAIYVGKTLYDTSATTYLSIFIDGVTTIDLKETDILYVQASNDLGNLFEISPDSDHNAGVNRIFIDSATHTGALIPAGSAIYLSPTLSSGRIKIAYDEIDLSVKKSQLRDYLNGQFLGQINSPSNPLSIDSPGLPIKLYKDDIVRISPNPAAGQDATSHPTVYRTITKSSGDPFYDVGITTGITHSGSEGTIYTDMLIYLEYAGPINVGSSIQILLDSIVFDTAIIKSEDYNPGVSGWAIKGDGSAEFNNISMRGDLRADGTWISGSNPTYAQLDSGQLQFNAVLNTLDFNINGYMRGLGLEFESNLISTSDPLNKVALHSQLLEFSKWNGSSWDSVFRASTGGTVTIDSYGQPIPRVFSGSSVPSTVTNSVVGDLYRRTGTEELYIKTANPTTWLKIGPFNDGDFVTYSQSTGNPSSTPENGSLYYDTSNGKAHIRISGNWYPLFNGIKKAYNTSNTYLGPVMVWRGTGLATPPADAENGHMYKDNVGGVFVHNGTGWDPLI